MAKYRFIAEEPRWVPDLRLSPVEPGEVVEFPDDYTKTHYLQVGEKGEQALWEAVTDRPRSNKSTKKGEE